MILPLVFLAFHNLQSVISTTNHAFICSHSIGQDVNYHSNLLNLLGALTSQGSNDGFYSISTTLPKARNQLHGLYLCRGDIDPQACRSCINSAKNRILEHLSCPREALVWYNHCMIRYSNQSFFGKWDKNFWSSSCAMKKIKGNRIQFMKILSNTMELLAIRASNVKNANKFASTIVKVSRLDSLDAKVQCTPDLVASVCYRCLRKANHQLLRMRGSTNGQVLHASCMAQYTTTTNSTLISLRELGTQEQHDLGVADKSK